MASVHPRRNRDGTTTYRVAFRVDGRQKTESFTDIKGAESFRQMIDRLGPQAAREALHLRRGIGTSSAPLVSDEVRAYIASRTGITNGTRRRYYQLAGKHIDPALGSLRLDHLTRQAVSAFVNNLAESGLSGASVRNIHSILSGALQQALYDGRVQSNPCKGIRLPRTDTPDAGMTILTNDELVRLVHAVPDPWRPLLALLAGSGMRMGEATALQVRDVQLDARGPDGSPAPQIRVVRAWKHTNGNGRELGPPKSKRSRRTIYLDPGLASVLAPLVDCRPGDALVIESPTRPGHPVSQQTFHDVFKKALAAAGIDRRIRVHDLRHTYASTLIAGGLDVLTVSSQLGHEDPKTTLSVYGHLFPGAGQRVALTIGQALAPAFPQLEG